MQFNLNKLLNEDDLEQEEQDKQVKRKHYLIEVEDEKDSYEEDEVKDKKGADKNSKPKVNRRMPGMPQMPQMQHPSQ